MQVGSRVFFSAVRIIVFCQSIPSSNSSESIVCYKKKWTLFSYILILCTSSRNTGCDDPPSVSRLLLYVSIFGFRTNLESVLLDLHGPGEGHWHLFLMTHGRTCIDLVNFGESELGQYLSCVQNLSARTPLKSPSSSNKSLVLMLAVVSPPPEVIVFLRWIIKPITKV
jgi:hypothetical protein